MVRIIKTEVRSFKSLKNNLKIGASKTHEIVYADSFIDANQPDQSDGLSCVEAQ